MWDQDFWAQIPSPYHTFKRKADLGSDTICNDRASTVPDCRVHILQPRLRSPSFHKLLGASTVPDCHVHNLLPQKLVKTWGLKLGLKYVHIAVGNCGGSVVTKGIRTEVGSPLEGVKLVKTRGPKPGLKYVHTAVGNCGGSVITNGIRAEVGSLLEGVVG
nr:hypothetical protein CFP56_53200 [Quercus suber]